METKSVFQNLAEVPVNNKVRQKGNFWYVSWSNAVRELLKRYPEANWDFTQYNGIPYLKTDAGCFVECAVTVEGITRKQMMPILNFNNQVEEAPDAAQVNKAQMRALTKAIALHGFGLDLWAGEDLDEMQAQPQHEEPRKDIDYLAEIKAALKSQGKTHKQFFEYASQVVKREVSKFDELTEQELYQFSVKLGNAK